MKGSFKSSEEITGFLDLIKNISLIVDESGIILNFGKKENNEVPVKIGSYVKPISTIVSASCKNLFNNFEFDTENGCKIGIVKLNEFVNLFSLFDSNSELNFNFDESAKSLTLSQGKSKVVYQTADTDLITEYTKKFQGTTWFTSFDYDSNFKKFEKAMHVLSGEECITFEGKSSDSELTISIKNKSVTINSYVIDIPVSVSQDFSVVHKKSILENILCSKYEKIKVSVGEKMLMIEGSSKFSEVVYFVAKMSA